MGDSTMSVCAARMQGAVTLSSLSVMRGAHAAVCGSRPVTRLAPCGFRMSVVRAAGPQKGGVNPVKSGSSQPGNLQGSGTRYVGGRRVKVLPLDDKKGSIRDKAAEGPEAIKLLSRVEQLRLLSKAERAGLLTTAENLGFSLSKIESLGLLSKAEELGVLSAATNPNTPGTLLTTALALLLLGPLFVYYVPETSTPLVVLQVLVAVFSVVGGSAAFGAANFVSTLQNSD